MNLLDDSRGREAVANFFRRFRFAKNNRRSGVYDGEHGGKLCAEVGEGVKGEGGVSWGCPTPPLLHRRNRWHLRPDSTRRRRAVSGGCPAFCPLQSGPAAQDLARYASHDSKRDRSGISR